MNVLIYEPYKLFNKRRLIVITLLLALVCVLMTVKQPANDFYSDSAIRMLHNDLVDNRWRKVYFSSQQSI